MTQGIAFFDFDDTLARGDSILPFLLYCIRKRISPRRQLIKAAGAFLYWKLRPSRRQAGKAASSSRPAAARRFRLKIRMSPARSSAMNTCRASIRMG